MCKGSWNVSVVKLMSTLDFMISKYPTFMQ